MSMNYPSWIDRKEYPFDPNYFDGHLNLGRALLQQRKPAEAAAHFQLALQINPGSVRAQRGLAAIQAMLNGQR